MAKEKSTLLPNSARMLGNEKVGVDNSDYRVKQVSVGNDLNALPPGMAIENQANADIRDLPHKNYSGGLSYPGDGW